MNFAILAAGLGSRLNNEGLNKPKGLVKLNGIPMIERLIQLISKFDYNSLSIIINGNSETLEKHIKKITNGMNINLLVKNTPGSMHSLYEMRDWLKDDYFCLFTVDTVFREKEFSSYINYARNLDDYDAVMAATPYIDDEKPLYIRTNQFHDITAFPDDREDTSLVSGGIYYFAPTVIDVLNECFDKGIHMLRNFQRMLLERQLKVKAFEFSKIIDVDHIKDIDKAEKFLKDEK